jgi:hypothetical protein
MRHRRVGVGLEGAVGQPGLAQVLPDVLHGIEFGRVRRQPDRRDVLGHDEIRRAVPASAVEEKHGLRADRDVAADFLEMEPASPRCRQTATPAPRPCLLLGRWRRRDRRSRSVGLRAVEAAFLGAPIAAQGRSSGQCALRPYMRLPLSRHDRVLPRWSRNGSRGGLCGLGIAVSAASAA